MNNKKSLDPSDRMLLQSLKHYQVSSARRGQWQILNTFIPYLGLWVAMYFTVGISWILTLALAVLASGFLLRIFVIFHDCAHGSFFKSTRANEIVGVLGGLLVFTPFHQWQREHQIHHGTSGNLDRRGIGDVWTMTVQEYKNASWRKRLFYRLVRSSWFLFVFAPYFLILGWQRIPSKHASLRIKAGVMATTLVLAAAVWGMCLWMGTFNYMVIQLTILGITGSSGVWLFYMQHQFENAYWKRNEEWDFVEAALKGSTYYRLPRLLQWFTASIGFHHIHHLSPRIPNYRLEECHQVVAELREVQEVGFWEGFKSLPYRLWDERTQKLVGFSSLT